MKHYINIAIVMAAAVLMCSCELDTSGNGDLDGMWHLTSIDTLSTSGVKRMNEDKIYWSFQYRLLQLEDKSGAAVRALLRFEHKNGTLRLYDPYIYDREDGDKPLTDSVMLAPYGINALEETFTVEGLSGNKMVLRTDKLRLSFRKL